MKKLTFGDLQGKADAINHHKQQSKFEKQVKYAMAEMKGFITLPASNEGIYAYPEHMRRYDLRVLREACYRISRERLRATGPIVHN